MGLSEVVASLAEAIAAARQPLSPREAYLLHVLRGMPLYRDIGRLDLWESAYNEVAPADGASETERLIDDLFGLGQYNLYGAFDAGGTVTYYHRLLASLAGSGIKPPPVADIQNW
jgi:hypothetical protein